MQNEMDATLLESLLYQEESETLDCKSEQYRFTQASKEEKSELLKDVLAFANAWRQSDAYILIGVEEVKAGRSIVHGVQHHLTNEHLQQFVTSKTNMPVLFNYAPVALDAVQIGVLTIPIQDRPLFLKQDYGKLKSDTVYIRRGATTDTAKPDEIFRMGQSAVPARSEPTLVFQFADLANRKELGGFIGLRSKVVLTPGARDIPKYGQDSPFAWTGSTIRNDDYYRDVAAYIRDKQLIAPIGFVVENTSPNPAEEVHVTLTLNTDEGLILCDALDVPQPPSTMGVPAIQRARHPHEPTVRVERFGSFYEVKSSLGSIHPRTIRWSPQSFYVGATQKLRTIARVTVSANNVPIPITLQAEIDIEAENEEVTTEQIIRLAKTIQKNPDAVKYSKPVQQLRG